MKFSAIESFSGAGGMSLGLRDAGFDIKLAFDNVSAHVKTYNHNLGPHAKVLDARKVSGDELLSLAGLGRGQLDLFSGGPPCQGFSKQRRGAAFLQDPRNRLVLDFARLVSEMLPRAFLFENVAIFGQKRGLGFIEEIAELLSEYSITCFQVCGSDFGLAQTRSRFLMIGILADISARSPDLVTSDEYVSVRDVIGDLPPPPNDCSEHPEYFNHQKCRITALNEERFSHVPQGGGWQDIPWDLRLPCHKVTDVRKGGWPDVYGRLAWDSQCPTITVGFDSFTRGRYGHPEQHRAITPREAARLQGFPDNFRFLGNRMDVRTQIGNAVPPPLAKAAGTAIANILSGQQAAPVRNSVGRQLRVQRELAL
ncbi:DNA cytosine methyltransferase [Stakelama tenebrarum]|uniref:Cytosine-specific methyltransferase n=1 Tax=Stakelama tenebrarum TaxID=2711215 RepID=A0A6G6Y650_9SPHN|nr:DNA cytosine methyltransferase [Sphingosinithalassobacter tenebrarum]QIG80390.1 DNA cytosine methyltransferase [Sphingosinithalassobacter tenebrarum]